jgi:hypothetical protein
MGDAIENDLPRGQLNSLNRLLFGIPVQEDVQFRHFGNPTAVDFTVEFDREFHSHRLAPMAGVIAESEMQGIAWRIRARLDPRLRPARHFLQRLIGLRAIVRERLDPRVNCVQEPAYLREE